MQKRTGLSVCGKKMREQFRGFYMDDFELETEIP